MSTGPSFGWRGRVGPSDKAPVHSKWIPWFCCFSGFLEKMSFVYGEALLHWVEILNGSYLTLYWTCLNHCKMVRFTFVGVCPTFPLHFWWAKLRVSLSRTRTPAHSESTGVSHWHYKLPNIILVKRHLNIFEQIFKNHPPTDRKKIDPKTEPFCFSLFRARPYDECPYDAERCETSWSVAEVSWSEVGGVFVGWLWVKKKTLGDHRFWSIFSSGCFGMFWVAFFDP